LCTLYSDSAKGETELTIGRPKNVQPITGGIGLTYCIKYNILISQTPTIKKASEKSLILEFQD